MVRKVASQGTNHARVQFELPASLWADRVIIVGNFNQWCPMSTPLKQTQDGSWRVVVDLPTGKHYQYRYLINGEWRADFQADGFVTVTEGIHNSVLNLT
jgi:1,4-alpha-glucan branching enzyme